MENGTANNASSHSAMTAEGGGPPRAGVGAVHRCALDGCKLAKTAASCHITLD